MKKFVFIFLITAISLLCLVSPASASSPNLILNGNASEGMVGWNDPDGIWISVDSYGIVTPYDGCFFTPVDTMVPFGEESRIYQDIAVAGYAGREAEYSAYVRTWDTNNTDETRLVVEFLDVSGHVLDSGSVTSANNPEWHRISVVKTIPKEAVTARLSLYAVYLYGGGCDSYFDEVSFVVSEPTQAFTGNADAEASQMQEIRIVLNGQTITPGGAGNRLNAIIRDGTLYLPAEVLPNALGMDVRWDAASATLYIDGAQGAAREPAADVPPTEAPPVEAPLVEAPMPANRTPQSVEPPTLEDFLWLTHEIYSEGAPDDAYRLDFSEATGAWQIYIINDPTGAYGSGSEMLLTGYIDGTESNASLTLDWYFCYIEDTEESYIDDAPDSVFTGYWDEGALEVDGAGYVEMIDFFRLAGKECAIGWMMWPDGEEAFVAMTRDIGQ